MAAEPARISELSLLCSSCSSRGGVTNRSRRTLLTADELRIKDQLIVDSEVAVQESHGEWTVGKVTAYCKDNPYKRFVQRNTDAESIELEFLHELKHGINWLFKDDAVQQGLVCKKPTLQKADSNPKKGQGDKEKEKKYNCWTQFMAVCNKALENVQWRNGEFTYCEARRLASMMWHSERAEIDKTLPSYLKSKTKVNSPIRKRAVKKLIPLVRRFLAAQSSEEENHPDCDDMMGEHDMDRQFPLDRTAQEELGTMQMEAEELRRQNGQRKPMEEEKSGMDTETESLRKEMERLTKEIMRKKIEELKRQVQPGPTPAEMEKDRLQKELEELKRQVQQGPTPAETEKDRLQKELEELLQRKQQGPTAEELEKNRLQKELEELLQRKQQEPTAEELEKNRVQKERMEMEILQKEIERLTKENMRKEIEELKRQGQQGPTSAETEGRKRKQLERLRQQEKTETECLQKKLETERLNKERESLQNELEELRRKPRRQAAEEMEWETLQLQKERMETERLQREGEVLKKGKMRKELNELKRPRRGPSPQEMEMMRMQDYEPAHRYRYRHPLTPPEFKRRRTDSWHHRDGSPEFKRQRTDSSWHHRDGSRSRYGWGWGGSPY